MSAETELRPLTIRLITLMSQPMCSASSFWVRPNGFRNSSLRISPGAVGFLFMGTIFLLLIFSRWRIDFRLGILRLLLDSWILVGDRQSSNPNSRIPGSRSQIAKGTEGFATFFRTRIIQGCYQT